MKTIEHKGRFSTYKVTYDDSEQAKQSVFDAVLAFFFKHEQFSGEGIQQCDEPITEAPNLLSDIADDILKMDVDYGDER